MRMKEIIKEKRRELNLTQEQMAERLGVTAPAVYKWEKGISFPDVTLLPALARLLKTDLNTLFSFEQELTEEEIALFCNEMIERMQQDGYEAGFQAAMEKIRQFPGCEKLIFQAASVLDGMLTLFCVEERKEYETEIEKLYERASLAEDVQVRDATNQLLIMKALQKKDYDRAEQLWELLPETVIDKKMIRATIYMNRQQFSEAVKVLEELLYVAATRVQNYLVDLQICFYNSDRKEEREASVDVLKKVVRDLGLWEYGAHLADYQEGIARKDREMTLRALKKMLLSMNGSYCLHDFMLYREISQKQEESSHMQLMAHALIENLKKENGVDGEGFLKGDEELQKLFEEFGKNE